MTAQPKYKVFRTVRSTMSATGLGFGEARKRRTATLRRSKPGRTILAREARKRELARVRREVKREEARKRDAERRRFLERVSRDYLPFPKFNRDYGPDTPYAVVFKLHWYKILQTPEGPEYKRAYTYHTETYRSAPDEETIQRTMDMLYSTKGRSDTPMGESDMDSDWELGDITVEDYYVSAKRVA